MQAGAWRGTGRAEEKEDNPSTGLGGGEEGEKPASPGLAGEEKENSPEEDCQPVESYYYHISHSHFGTSNAS